MPPSLRRVTGRLAGVGPGLVDTFLRDNKVLPPVLALLALLVFAWVVAGTYLDGSGEERVSSQSEVAQSQIDPNADPIAPEAENRDVESYAAYRSKDPFRQLLAPAESTSSQTSGESTQQPTQDGGGSGGSGAGGTTTGPARAQDSDQDGLTDRKEAALAQDPQNPDTDGDGIPDGADDADGDGRPDGRASGGSDASAPSGASASPDAGAGGDDGSGTSPGGGSAGASAPPSGDAGGSGRGGDAGGARGGGQGRGDDLPDSGGSLYTP